MLVMRTVEGCAYPLGQFVGRQQPVGLDHPTLAVNPLRFYRVQPRTLLRQKAANDPDALAAPFDLSIVGGYPGAHLFAYVPAGVIPDKYPYFLAHRGEPLGAPLKEAGGYAANRTVIHKTQPHLFKLRHKKPVAGDGLGIGVLSGDRLLHQAQGLACFAPAVESWPPETAPPGLVTEAHRPGVGIVRGHSHQPVASSFFLWYSGSGEVIQRLALSQRTPSRSKVARTVSPLTRSFVKPSSKLTSAAISNVHKLVSLPNFRGSW